MVIKPLQGMLLIEDVEVESVTQSGLILTADSKSKPVIGRVVASGCEEEAEPIHAGDVVVYSKYTGNDVRADGKDYVIIRYKDVLAKVE